MFCLKTLIGETIYVITTPRCGKKLTTYELHVNNFLHDSGRIERPFNLTYNKKNPHI